jgi:hypothetical protein
MYKNFNLTEEERKEIMESHKSHGYKKPINERAYVSKRYNDFDVVRGNPDFKTQTGRPSDEYLEKRSAALQFQQDFQKEFPDPGKEYKPYWEKDRPNSSGDSVDDLTPPLRLGKPDSADLGNPAGVSVQDVKSSFEKKEELEKLEKKVTALRLFKDQFGLDEHMTELYNNLLKKYREDLIDFNRGGVK